MIEGEINYIIKVCRGVETPEQSGPLVAALEALKGHDVSESADEIKSLSSFVANSNFSTKEKMQVEILAAQVFGQIEDIDGLYDLLGIREVLEGMLPTQFLRGKFFEKYEDLLVDQALSPHIKNILSGDLNEASRSLKTLRILKENHLVWNNEENFKTLHTACLWIDKKNLREVMEMAGPLIDESMDSSELRSILLSLQTIVGSMDREYIIESLMKILSKNQYSPQQKCMIITQGCHVESQYLPEVFGTGEKDLDPKMSVELIRSWFSMMTIPLIQNKKKLFEKIMNLKEEDRADFAEKYNRLMEDTEVTDFTGSRLLTGLINTFVELTSEQRKVLSDLSKKETEFFDALILIPDQQLPSVLKHMTSIKREEWQDWIFPDFVIMIKEQCESFASHLVEFLHLKGADGFFKRVEEMLILGFFEGDDFQIIANALQEENSFEWLEKVEGLPEDDRHDFLEKIQELYSIMKEFTRASRYEIYDHMCRAQPEDREKIIEVVEFVKELGLEEPSQKALIEIMILGDGILFNEKHAENIAVMLGVFEAEQEVYDALSFIPYSYLEVAIEALSEVITDDEWSFIDILTEIINGVEGLDRDFEEWVLDKIKSSPLKTNFMRRLDDLLLYQIVNPGTPLFEKIIDVLSKNDPDTKNDPFHHVALFVRLRNDRKPIEISPEVENGKQWNVQKLQQEAAPVIYTASDLQAFDVNSETLQALFEKVEAGPINHQHAQELYGKTFNELKDNLLKTNQSYVLQEFTEREIQDPSQRIEAAHYQTYAILNAIGKEPREQQEVMLLSLSNCIGECVTGQKEGIATYFMGLHLVPKGSGAGVSSFSKFSQQVIQQAMNATFKNTDFLKANGALIAQAPHQIFYLQNLLGKSVGYAHDVVYDPHADYIANDLRAKSEKSLGTSFFKFLTIKKVAKALTEAFNNLSQVYEQEKKAKEKLYALRKSPNAPREEIKAAEEEKAEVEKKVMELARLLSYAELGRIFDMSDDGLTFMIGNKVAVECNDSYAPVRLTEEGAYALLEKFEYIEQAKKRKVIHSPRKVKRPKTK